MTNLPMLGRLSAIAPESSIGRSSREQSAPSPQWFINQTAMPMQAAASCGEDESMTLLPLFGLLAATVGAHDAVSLPQGPREPVVLAMEPWRKSVALRVNIAGKERLFSLDTAGGISFISPDISAELGCDRGAQITGVRMTGDALTAGRCDDVDLSISGHQLHAPVVGVLDLAPLVAKDAEPLDGMIALDLFDGQVITVDFAAGRLIIESHDSAAARMANAVELPARMAREVAGRALAFYVDVPSSIGVLPFELDSGNGGTILVTKTNAAALGIDPDKGPQHGSIAIGKGIEASGVLFPADIIIDGNLGMPFLKDYLVTFDLENGRLFLERNPVPAPAGMGAAPPLPGEQ